LYCSTTHILSHSFNYFFFKPHLDPRHLHSFPTRRSSDLVDYARVLVIHKSVDHTVAVQQNGFHTLKAINTSGWRRHSIPGMDVRSEEHTSELQSRGHLVCRLLLEKKKQYSEPGEYSHYMN